MWQRRSLGRGDAMFGSRLTLFEVLGFKVRVDASWLLLAGLIVWSLAAGYFPAAAPGFGVATYWTMGAAGLIGLALSVVLHELAHSLVARRHGMAIAGITLFLFGGVAELAAEPKGPKGEFRMAVAGPLTSLGLAGLAWGAGLAAAAAGAPAGNPALAVVGYLATVNLFLAAFNMVPAFPLDGGRVLRAALWAWRGDPAWATRMAAGSGVACGFALMGLGAWNVAAGAWVAGVWWFVLGLFLRAAARRPATPVAKNSPPPED